MTLMAFLLLVILFLAMFIFFFNLNPEQVAIIFWPGHEVTTSLAVLVVGSMLLGLLIGYLFHLYGAIAHLLKDWRRSRREKKARSVSSLYQQGNERILSGDFKKARRLLQKALDLDASRVEVVLALAKLFRLEGAATESISCLQRAQKLAPDNLEVLFRLGEGYLAAGQTEEALNAYRGILALEGDNAEALRRLRDLHMRGERWGEALDLQRRIVKKAPEAVLATEADTLAALRLEKARQALADSRFDSAAAELKALVKERPDYAPARVLLGDALCGLQNHEEAATVWQQGYDQFGQGVFLSRLEELALAAEDPSGLLAFYRTAAQARPEDLLLRLFYGKFCLRLEMVDEALELLGEIEKSGADFPQLHLLLAEVHARRDRPEMAIREFRQAVAANGRLAFAFACERCGVETADWQGRCPACGAWDACRLAGREFIKPAPALSLREIHHGEIGL